GPDQGARFETGVRNFVAVSPSRTVELNVTAPAFARGSVLALTAHDRYPSASFFNKPLDRDRCSLRGMLITRRIIFVRLLHGLLIVILARERCFISVMIII